MKKHILFAIFFLQISFLTAQSLVVTGDMTCYGDVNSQALHTIEHYLDVTNTSNTSIDVLCQKTIIGTLPVGLPSWGGPSYCFANYCYGASQTTPSEVATLAPGQLISHSNADADAFTGYYDAEGITGEATVQYCFYDKNNIVDSTCVTMTYIIEETLNSSNNINSASVITDFYPNPANATINFDYYLNKSAELIVMDILGNEVKTIHLSEKGTQKVDISDFSKGIYFGNVAINNQVVTIKKIVVR